MKHIITLVTVLLLQICCYAQLNIPFGKNHKIIYNLKTGTYTVVLNGQTVFKNVYAIAQNIDSRTPIKRTYSKNKSVYTITSGPLQQIFYTFPDKDYCILAIQVAGISCNYLSPLNTTDISGADHMLNVPFDNDMWVRYDAPEVSLPIFREQKNFNSSSRSEFITSSEVTTLFTDTSATIFGSLNQSTWKTAIQLKNNLLSVFSGYTDSLRTHDNTPHGFVKPINGYCTSAPIYLGYNKDWRTALESYAQSFPHKTTKTTPLCWNSWGVIQTKITLDKAQSVVDFFHDSCTTFRTTNQTLYIDLDSYWDNLSPEQLKTFATYCKSKGFKPGIYWAPFVDWGKSDRPVEGTNYHYKDTWTTQQNHYIDLDGGRAMDPTHPATRQRIIHYITLFKNWGFEMIKIDFLSHGALESDHFYNPTVTTGMQAFHHGMKLIDSIAGKNMLLYAAISPNIATAPYVHMRRIACDAFSSIENTEYTLNSTAYGWWQSFLYPYLDADHVVFKDADYNANKARLASALVTGTLVTGDDFSINGPWKTTALQLLQDKDLLAITKTGKPFRPLDGNKIFIRDDGYIALFNYTNIEQTYHIPVKRSGTATELFSKQTITVMDTLNVNLSAGSVAIYKL